MIAGYLTLVALRAKLLVLTTLLAFFLGEPLSTLAQLDRVAASLHQRTATLGKKLNRPMRPTSVKLYRGVIVAVLLLVPACFLGHLLDGHGAVRSLFSVLLLVALLGRGFTTVTLFKRWQMAREARLMLESDDKLFGDTHGVLRHLILVSAEGFAGVIIGGGFWFALGGFALMLPYLILALAAAQYTTGRDADRPFAWAVTALYGLMDAPPRLLAALLLTIAGLCVPRTHPFAGLAALTLRQKKWYGFVAALLGISLGGRVLRPAGELNLPWLGSGSAQLTPRDLSRWLAVLGASTLLWLILLALPGYLTTH